MLKNKIISLMSVLALVSSFATVVSAEKVSPITNPAFYITANGYNEDESAYEYLVGFTFDEFTGTNPIDFEKGSTGGSRPKDTFKGTGIDLVEVIFDTEKLPEIVASYPAFAEETLSVNDSLNTNGSIKVVDTARKTLCHYDKVNNKPVFFYIYTASNEDISNFVCSKLTISLLQFPAEATQDASAYTNVIYSSDPGAIEAEAADFLCYTAPVGGKAKEGEILDVSKDQTLSTFADGDTLTYAKKVALSDNVNKYVVIKDKYNVEKKSLQNIMQMLQGVGQGSVVGNVHIYVKCEDKDNTFTVTLVD